MSMTTHTPGPWRVGEIDEKHRYQYVYANREYPNSACVAQVRSETILRSELNANARLIAAAPRMLEALKDALTPLIRLGDFIGNEDKGGASGLGPFDRCTIIGKVRDAIAQAEGKVNK